MGAALVAVVAGCGPRLAVTDDGAVDGETSADEGAGDDVATLDAGEVAGDDDAVTTNTTCGGWWKCTDVPPPPEYDCDFWAQDCDPEEKCVVVDDRDSPRRCVPVQPDGAPPYEPCTAAPGLDGTDTCDASSACVFDETGEMGICQPFCERLPSGPVCQAPWDASACLDQPGVSPVCPPLCDPRLPGACALGWLCAPFEGATAEAGFGCAPSAVEVPAGPGEWCSCPTCCLDGLTCVTGVEYGAGCDGGSCCTAWCDVDAPDPGCGGVEQTCVPVFDAGVTPPLDEWAGVGRCVVP